MRLGSESAKLCTCPAWLWSARYPCVRTDRDWLYQRVSSVSTNLVLTTRKAISLCFSVWWFGNGWNAQLGAGAGMVFLGSLFYTAVTSRAGRPSLTATATAHNAQSESAEDVKKLE